MDELEMLCNLRANIRGYLGQADQKALGIVMACPYDHLKTSLYKVYLKVVDPDLEYPKAPKGYELMNCRTKEHIEYEIQVCRKILFKKYEIINKMLIIAK